MVFVITGTAESDTNSVGRLLADDLGWEFVDGKNLHISPPILRRGTANIRRSTLVYLCEWKHYQPRLTSGSTNGGM